MNVDIENDCFIYKFDTKVHSIEELNILCNSFIVITSKRASSKSTLVKNLVKYLFDAYDYQFHILFTDTYFNGDFDDIIDKDFVFKSDQLDEKIDKILTFQEKNIKSNKIIHGLIILDDVKVFKKSKMLIDLACKSRHYKLTVICSVQYPKELISSSIRSNIDYLLWNDLNITGLRSVYESIAIPMNFKNFINIVNQYNTDYRFFYYTSKESNKNERLKLVKARLFENLKLIK
jgi:hypothetical protein